MKLALQQEYLKKVLAQVSRAVPGKPTLPILSNVLLTTDQGRLRSKRRTQNVKCRTACIDRALLASATRSALYALRFMF